MRHARKTAIIVGAFTAAACLTGCCMSNAEFAEALHGPMQKVVSRYDVYVNADDSLDQGTKDLYLTTSALLMENINTALEDEQTDK